MEEKTIRRNLYRVLRKTGVPKNEIKTNASFSDDLNFDTVDWDIFTFYLTDTFNIHVKDEENLRFSSVDETIQYLKLPA